jgi:hypothetical protein
VIVCEQRFDVGRRVVTWEDDPAFSAYTLHCTDKPTQIYPYAPAKGLGAMAARYRPRRLIGGDRSLTRLRQVVRQFVVHHDGCASSRMCFQVLHNERGLSVHFLIDNDGTIFQTLDLVDCAFQAAGVNEISIGVELANRGDALRFPDDYRGLRDKLTCRIHGHQFLAYEYTRAQLESMTALGRAMARVFPNLPQTYPLAGDGEQLWTALPDPREYAGYLGHYHVTQQKWDPGPFDFRRFASTIRGLTFFPLALSPGEKPEVPDDPSDAEARASELYDNNEGEGEGGYFPVGPFDQSRLWHGGAHLRADKGTPLYAPFAGKVVAARMTDPCPIGSRNFVLMRHDLSAGGGITFFTLLFHLDDESEARWYKEAARLLGEEAVPLAIEVAAGELVGHVGEAGPPGRAEGQVHVEFISAEELGERLEPSFWHTIDASGPGPAGSARFCNVPEIVDKIDRPQGASGRRDGVLSRAEVLSFFRGDPRRQELRKLAVRHLSEWADENDWQVALQRSREFAALPKFDRTRLFKDQIEPVLWWTDEIGDSAGLPADKIAWTYHPVTFLVWMHDRLRGTGAGARGISGASDFRGAAPPRELKDDAEATEGFVDDEDALSGEAAKKLDLEDLVKGYPDDK